MTDAEKFVKDRWPEATIWGPMKNGQQDPAGNWVIHLKGTHSYFSGSGKTQIAAWADAANRIEQRAARERKHD